MAEDPSESSQAPASETADAESVSDEHTTETTGHADSELPSDDQEQATEEAHEDLVTEDQTETGHSDPAEDHAEAEATDEAALSDSEASTTAPAPIGTDEARTETASNDDHGDPRAADGHSDTQDDSQSAEQEPHDQSAEATNATVGTSAPDTKAADDSYAEPNAETPRATQQAALPKVTAPDHNSLPQWQRNRQNIDRRWLKDAEGKPKPRIAFVLSELGLAPIAAEEIIKKLPPGITLSFSPYAKPRSLEYLSALARANGHEVMLDLPLEPIDFPQRDPGPKALLTALEPKENLDRLAWSLNRATGYVGVAVWMGSRFVGSPRQMRPLYEAIRDRGLLVLDNAEREDSLSLELAGEFGVPTVSSHRYVDVPLASRDAIDARLAQVERIALQFGSAVAMGRPFPVTVERLAEWSADLEKRGIVLVPITVLAEEVGRQQKLAYKPVKKSVPQAKTPDAEASSAD